MAKLCEISYYAKDRRIQTYKMGLGSVSLEYKQDLSYDLFAHYESENIIVIAVHGAYYKADFLEAVKQWFAEGISQYREDALKQTIDLLEKTNKKIYFTGHSLGCWMIAFVFKKFNKKFDTIFFAPFAPRSSYFIGSGWSKIFGSNEVQIWFATQRWIRKFYYIQDCASNGLYDITNRQHTIEYSNKLTGQLIGHLIGTFANKDISADLVK